ANLCPELGDQRLYLRQSSFLFVEDRMERLPLERRERVRGERPLAGHTRGHDVDQAVGTVEPAPKRVVLAVGAAEKGAKTVELDPLEHRRCTAGADRGRIGGGNAVDLDRVELVEPFALQQR